MRKAFWKKKSSIQQTYLAILGILCEEEEQCSCGLVGQQLSQKTEVVQRLSTYQPLTLVFLRKLIIL